MASFGKVLRGFGDIGKKFNWGHLALSSMWIYYGKNISIPLLLSKYHAQGRTYIIMNFQAMAAHHLETVVTAGRDPALKDPIEAKRAVAEVIIDYELKILKV